MATVTQTSQLSPEKGEVIDLLQAKDVRTELSDFPRDLVTAMFPFQLPPRLAAVQVTAMLHCQAVGQNVVGHDTKPMGPLGALSILPWQGQDVLLSSVLIIHQP